MSKKKVPPYSTSLPPKRDRRNAYIGIHVPITLKQALLKEAFVRDMSVSKLISEILSSAMEEKNDTSEVPVFRQAVSDP